MSGSDSSTTLGQLPDELLALVALYSGIPAISSLARVSRHFREALNVRGLACEVFVDNLLLNHQAFHSESLSASEQAQVVILLKRFSQEFNEYFFRMPVQLRGIVCEAVKRKLRAVLEYQDHRAALSTYLLAGFFGLHDEYSRVAPAPHDSASGFEGAQLIDKVYSGLCFRNVSFNNATLKKVSFFFSNLHGASFKDASFNDVNFSFACLTNVTWPDRNLAAFSGIEVVGAILDKAAFEFFRSLGFTEFKHCCFVGDFQGANFENCELKRASFKAVTSFSGVNFSGAKLYRMDLRGGGLSGICRDADSRLYINSSVLDPAAFLCLRRLGLKNFLKVRFVGDFAGVDFSGCELGGASFKEANVHGAIFHKISIRSSTFFRGLYAQGVRDFFKCHFVGDFRDCCFDDCSLINALFFDVRLFCASVSNANFSRAKLLRVRWSGVSCDARALPVLEGAELDRAAFEALRNLGCRDFSGATFSGDFRGVDFRHCHLRGAKFSRAKLQHADFFGANISGATFSEVKLMFVWWGPMACDSVSTPVIENTVLDRAAFEVLRKLGCRDFSKARFVGNFEGADFSDCDLRGADFSGIIVCFRLILNRAKVNFKTFEMLRHLGQHDFSGAKFLGGFHEMDFNDCVLEQVDLSGVTIERCRLSLDRFQWLRLQGCRNFLEVDFFGGFKGALFDECRLQQVSFAEVDSLERASFCRANLARVDWGRHLSGLGRKVFEQTCFTLRANSLSFFEKAVRAVEQIKLRSGPHLSERGLLLVFLASKPLDLRCRKALKIVRSGECPYRASDEIMRDLWALNSSHTGWLACILMFVNAYSAFSFVTRSPSSTL